MPRALDDKLGSSLSSRIATDLQNKCACVEGVPQNQETSQGTPSPIITVIVILNRVSIMINTVQKFNLKILKL